MKSTKGLCQILPGLALILALALVAGVASPAGSSAEAAAAATGAVTEVTLSTPVAQRSDGWTAGLMYPEMGTARVIDLPRAPAWQPGEPIKEIPRRHLRTDYVPTPAPRGYGMDQLAELQARTPVVEDRTFSSSSLNFAGIGYQPLNPPDPVGAVGRNYYIQMVNGSTGSLFAIYNKHDGSLVTGPTVLSSIVPPSMSNCSSGAGDPIVLYDHLAGRWIMTEFTNAGTELCFYVSNSGDPTGTWYRYKLTTPNFPDYPKYAVWPDAFFVSTNETGGPAVYAVEREAIYNYSGAANIRFTTAPLSGFNFQALTPADLDGDRTPLPNEPGIFMRHHDDEAHIPVGPPAPFDYLDMWEFKVDWPNHPGGHTFTQIASIQTSEFDSALCGLTSFSCFSQPSGGIGLDPLREVIMWRLQYRNFGIYETLVGNFVTDVNGSDLGGVRWFELRRQGPGVGSWTLHQEGTYSPDATVDRWMGSIAMDGGGNILLGYNYVNSSSAYASLSFVGRLATSAPGVMTSKSPIVSGAGVNASYRYGDYNALTIDPVDDCTFWFTGEYNPAAQWGTRISTFRFFQCPFELETIVADEEAGPEGGGGKR